VLPGESSRYLKRITVLIDVTKHLIGPHATIHDAMREINQLEKQMILFVVDEDAHLIGTLTDGDIRRALVENPLLEQEVSAIMNRNYRFIYSGELYIDDLSDIRRQGITLVPMLNHSKSIVEVLDLENTRSLLPVHAVLMAGGIGKRMLPLTETIPKPLLKVGGKHIIQYNLEHLARYGVKRMTISVGYLAEKIKKVFGDGSQFGWEISYVEEKEPLGTIGALAMVGSFSNDNLLVMNSDLLTNINFEDFYREFIGQSAAMAMATVPYRVRVPYGVLETQQNQITRFQEKPDYVYQSNAGIYLLRRQYVSLIPEGKVFNATDMMEVLVAKGEKVISYPILSYWLDIGRPEDFDKAGEDVRNIHF
jgi:dTDP-glucose pyrophosphorylase/CBS domain-containing protein